MTITFSFKKVYPLALLGGFLASCGLLSVENNQTRPSEETEKEVATADATLNEKAPLEVKPAKEVTPPSKQVVQKKIEDKETFTPKEELSDEERKELEYWENYYKQLDTAATFEPAEFSKAINRGCGCHDFVKDKDMILKDAQKHLSYINSGMMPYEDGWKSSDDGKIVVKYLEEHLAATKEASTTTETASTEGEMPPPATEMPPATDEPQPPMEEETAAAPVTMESGGIDGNAAFVDKCGVCHHWASITFRVKLHKESIVSALNDGTMPLGDDDWITSDEGKAALEWVNGL